MNGKSLDNQLIHDAIEYISALFKNAHDGHDAEHSLRVYRAALMLAEKETDVDMEVLALTALLHDADDHKLFATKNNENARKFLAEKHITAETAERICLAINDVSFSMNRGKKPETLEGKIVQDADRLDAIGAIGIARAFAYGGSHGRNLDASVNHFYDKLLLLKDEMNTASARKIAESRHAFMEAFLKEYNMEMDSEQGSLLFAKTLEKRKATAANAFDCSGADKRLVRKKHDENGWSGFDIVRM